MNYKIISVLRVSHKKTVEEVAEVLHLSVAKYLDLESGKAKVTPAKAMVLADLYFIEANIFLSDETPTININAGSNNRMVINLHSNKYFEHPKDDISGEEND